MSRTTPRSESILAFRNEYIEDRINKTARLFQIIETMTGHPHGTADHPVADLDHWRSVVTDLIDHQDKIADNSIGNTRREIMEITGLLSARGQRLS